MTQQLGYTEVMKQNTFGIVAAGLVIFVSGYVLGYLISDTADTAMTSSGNQIKETAVEVSDMATSSVTTPAAQNGDAVAFTINVENIPETQRAFLKTMGITGNEIVVTNTILACAQAEIGIVRMVEIQNGATPSVSEGLALAGCY